MAASWWRDGCLRAGTECLTESSSSHVWLKIRLGTKAEVQYVSSTVEWFGWMYVVHFWSRHFCLYMCIETHDLQFMIPLGLIQRQEICFVLLKHIFFFFRPITLIKKFGRCSICKTMYFFFSWFFQVFFVSDFFKSAESSKEIDIPHTTLQETPTNGNHFESPN